MGDNERLAGSAGILPATNVKLFGAFRISAAFRGQDARAPRADFVRLSGKFHTPSTTFNCTHPDQAMEILFQEYRHAG